MKIQVFALLFTVLIFPTAAEAQLSKQEKKQWKKQAKNYMKQPENLKLLMDQKAYSDGEARRLKGELSTVTDELGKKDDQIGELEDLISRMRVDAAVTKAELEKFKAGMVAPAASANAPVKRQLTTGQGDFSTGVVFKVQVGAFKNKDLSKYFDNNPNFGGEAGKEPTDPQRINIGIFRNYWEADKFKKYLREMGVKDAWIVPYRDGARIEIRDVLDMIVTDENPQD
jgi:hypothetical protein